MNNRVTGLTEGLSEERLRDYAWVGDAVLGLFMRGKILELKGRLDTPAFTAVTSNQFLSSFGSPTRVEAQIGVYYEREGVSGALQFIESEIWPRAKKKLGR